MIGLFDKEAVIAVAWFDFTAVTLGWWDPDLIDTAVVATADERLKPWQVQAQMGALVAQ